MRADSPNALAVMQDREVDASRLPGRLVLAATPIGDVADASPRLRELITTADVVAAEDTRRFHALARRMDVTPRGRVVSCYEHNEESRAQQLVNDVRAGATVLVVTDAGMPSVSDPGYRLVQAAIVADVPVTTVPGPSAVLAALAISGLPTDRFVFEGFVPRKRGERTRYFASLVNEERTVVFFESPHRLVATLEDMAHAFGDQRHAVVCRELTKVHEEVIRGNLAELRQWATGQVRGEVTLVVAGAVPSATAVSVDDVLDEMLTAVAHGRSTKDVSADYAQRTGLRRKELYDALIQARSSRSV